MNTRRVVNGFGNFILLSSFVVVAASQQSGSPTGNWISNLKAFQKSNYQRMELTLNGEPYTNGRTRWFMVEGPDNVFVQLTEAPQGAPNPGVAPIPR